MFDLKFIKNNARLLNEKNNPLNMKVDMYVAYEDIVLNSYMTFEERRQEFERRNVILRRMMLEREIGEYPCALKQHKSNLANIDGMLKDMPSLHLFFKYGDRLVPRTCSNLEERYTQRILREVKAVI